MPKVYRHLLYQRPLKMTLVFAGIRAATARPEADSKPVGRRECPRQKKRVAPRTARKRLRV